MKLYRRFFKYIEHNSQYINDFSNISNTTHNISTIFRIYRTQLTIYQRFFEYIEHNSQYINDFSNISNTTHNISTIFRIYRTQLTIYQRFFEYIDVSTRNIDLPTKTDSRNNKRSCPKWILEQPPLLTNYRTSFYIKQTAN